MQSGVTARTAWGWRGGGGDGLQGAHSQHSATWGGGVGRGEEGTAGLGNYPWEQEAFLSSVPPTPLKSGRRIRRPDHCLNLPSRPPAPAPTWRPSVPAGVPLPAPVSRPPSACRLGAHSHPYCPQRPSCVIPDVQPFDLQSGDLLRFTQRVQIWPFSKLVRPRPLDPQLESPGRQALKARSALVG